MKKTFLKFVVITLFSGFYSCSKDDSSTVFAPEYYLIVKFQLDPNQVRLNNLGQSAPIPAGNAAQTPVFNSISAHYFELAQTPNTQLGAGTVLYHAPETSIGGAAAIDFSKSKIIAPGETFLKIPLKQVASGTYQYVRVSLSYQNYQISIRNSGVDYPSTLASFVGFNTYIGSHSVGNSNFVVNANKHQGYWALNVNGMPFSGDAPANATTVPNPLFASSPIPQGSCVVTGKFVNNLIITGTENKDVIVNLSLSINKSFEWTEVIADGKFEPSANENVVDMGLRGLIPSFQ